MNVDASACIYTVESSKDKEKRGVSKLDTTGTPFAAATRGPNAPSIPGGPLRSGSQGSPEPLPTGLGMKTYEQNPIL